MKSARKRTVIENVSPQINKGEFYCKRVVGQAVMVEADIYADGHDVIRAEIAFKHEKEKSWQQIDMAHEVNDRWLGVFVVAKQGLYEFKVHSWVDYALSWQHNIERKIQDGQQVEVELKDGIEYLKSVRKKATTKEKTYLEEVIKAFKDKKSYKKAVKAAVSDKLHQLLMKYPMQDFKTTHPALKIYVDRKKALFSTWYEFFPRSTAPVEGKHGTFKDCRKVLPHVAAMGFDVVYFPPVHPIGTAFRKGKNNSTKAEKGDVGSPWAIGNEAGGHTAIHKELGTLKDFKSVIEKARELKMEIAMDFALQCAPDHPFVKENPEWFKWRADGTVQYAENPPKKYQDILPIYFETEDWENLWNELTEIALYWVKQGVSIFRVDNPHTKPFAFWQFLISKVKTQNPDVIFLSEAFTKPKVMQRLAKVGFSQSYTYFTWRNTKQELMEYMTELTKTDLSEYFRPNFWPNTPDINPYILQSGNQNIFITRYVLAATLSSNIGIYGPVFEQMVHEAIIGKEEYLNSEKYEVKHWDWSKTNKLKSIITLVNQIRKENIALQETNNIEFCSLDNDQLLAFHKGLGENHLLIVINLDPYHMQSGWVQVPMAKVGLQDGDDFRVHDLVTQQTYFWSKEWNYVALDPNALPFHLFKILT
ncbi:MAG: alpha-1,4-glucan--maltose-1-phosphate maltosyltransferase [Fulvivirga sp.]|nr:alpha-1,4-glucan--maltose-1-phosphate maltosyltransferase [Fulvivirga sp.]